MTKQETFDKVASHLLTQRERSVQFGVRPARSWRKVLAGLAADHRLEFKPC